MLQENQNKVDKFLSDLKQNRTILEVVNFFNKDVDTVCKLVKKFIIILYYKNGDIKEIKLDFLETQSNIKMFQKHNF